MTGGLKLYWTHLFCLEHNPAPLSAISLRENPPQLQQLWYLLLLLLSVTFQTPIGTMDLSEINVGILRSLCRLLKIPHTRYNSSTWVPSLQCCTSGYLHFLSVIISVLKNIGCSQVLLSNSKEIIYLQKRSVSQTGLAQKSSGFSLMLSFYFETVKNRTKKG